MLPIDRGAFPPYEHGKSESNGIQKIGICPEIFSGSNFSSIYGIRYLSCHLFRNLRLENFEGDISCCPCDSAPTEIINAFSQTLHTKNSLKSAHLRSTPSGKSKTYAI
ncbi:hypothetical protein TNCT_331681 [Trichonephila clavata]|uniref:Uncharacterized protein n=1 Tax=Trichonephila clavata TaxID=2740835 RepID=A0A8X6LVJ9_TRICU|nr:hypothetical protein TNCT_331681 [Trichonephila clavata]